MSLTSFARPVAAITSGDVLTKNVYNLIWCALTTAGKTKFPTWSIARGAGLSKGDSVFSTIGLPNKKGCQHKQQAKRARTISYIVIG